MSMPFEEELEPRSELSAETELIRGPFPGLGPRFLASRWRSSRKNISASEARNFKAVPHLVCSCEFLQGGIF